jgi:hypothetical protein
LVAPSTWSAPCVASWPQLNPLAYTIYALIVSQMGNLNDTYIQYNGDTITVPQVGVGAGPAAPLLLCCGARAQRHCMPQHADCSAAHGACTDLPWMRMPVLVPHLMPVVSLPAAVLE